MKRSEGNKGPSVAPIISKPFCDCSMCACNNCPDILQMIPISISENISAFGSKVAKGKGKEGKSGGKDPKEKKKSPIPQQETKRPSIMDVINKDRDCACEVMARALHSNIHMNLGLTEKRAALNTNRNSRTSKNLALEK